MPASDWQIPEAEYRRIIGSWGLAPRGGQRWNQVSDEDNADSCWLNMQQAARRVAELEAQIESLPQGDPLVVGTKECAPLSTKLVRARSDVAHWQECHQYYRNKRPTTAKPVRLKAVPQEPDRRLPRERDQGDDDMEGDLPF